MRRLRDRLGRFLSWGTDRGSCSHCNDDSEKEVRLWFDWFLCRKHWEEADQ